MGECPRDELSNGRRTRTLEESVSVREGKRHVASNSVGLAMVSDVKLQPSIIERQLSAERRCLVVLD